VKETKYLIKTKMNNPPAGIHKEYRRIPAGGKIFSY